MVAVIIHEYPVKTDHKEEFNNPENLIIYHQLLFWVTMITIKVLTIGLKEICNSKLGTYSLLKSDLR